MGFEAFRVELRGGRAKYVEADDAVRKLPHIKPDQHSVPTQGSRFMSSTMDSTPSNSN
jgi:hypothetical protein